MAGSHGGFSGGSSGSHSFSGSGSGSSNNVLASNRYFPGAVRYVYFNSLGARCYFYGSVTPTKKSIKSAIGAFIFGIFIALAIYLVFLFVNVVPHKMITNYQLTNYIYDEANLIDDDRLEISLKEFYQKTGVQPIIYTKDYDLYSSFMNVNSDQALTDYGTSIYYQLTNDENHWLILFVSDPSRTNYKCVEIYGDNTGTIITEALYDDFINRLKDNVAISSMNTTDAFIDAYNLAIDKALTWDKTKKDELSVGSIILVVALFVIILANVSTIKQYKKINDYCEYRDTKNNGVDNFEKIDPDEFKIDPNDY